MSVTDLLSEEAPDAPGIYEGLDIALYHSGPGISKTGLDDVAEAPIVYYRKHMDPERPEKAPTQSQQDGNLLHCVVLEPNEFDKRYVIGPDARRNAKEWKRAVELAGGRIVIKPDEYDTAMYQADAIRAEPECAEILSHGRAEVGAYWIDPETGVLCKCRPDWEHPVAEHAVVLADVKGYGSANPDEFMRQAARMRYDVQAAYYSDGYARAAGVEVVAFVFIVVTDKWPFVASPPIELLPASIELGRREARRALNTYARCIDTNTWPGYGTGIQQRELPPWRFAQEENQQ